MSYISKLLLDGCVTSYRSGFRADGMDVTNTDMNDLYSISNQEKLFASLFGSEQTLVSSSSFLLKVISVPLLTLELNVMD